MRFPAPRVCPGTPTPRPRERGVRAPAPRTPAVPRGAADPAPRTPLLPAWPRRGRSHPPPAPFVPGGRAGPPRLLPGPRARPPRGAGLRGRHSCPEASGVLAPRRGWPCGGLAGAGARRARAAERARGWPCAPAPARVWRVRGAEAVCGLRGETRVGNSLSGGRQCGRGPGAGAGLKAFSCKGGRVPVRRFTFSLDPVLF